MLLVRAFATGTAASQQHAHVTCMCLGNVCHISHCNVQAATSAPLIETSIEKATGIVYNITGGRDLTLQEVNRVSEVVTSLADQSANVIFGAVIDDQYEGEVHVTIIATGFSQTFEQNLLSGNVVAETRPPPPAQSQSSQSLPWNRRSGTFGRQSVL